MGGTLSLQFRYRPGHRPDVDRLVRSVQQVFAANAVDITCEAGPDAELASPFMESVSVNECRGAAIAEHRRLFATATGLRTPDELVVFVVRRIEDGGPLSGCAVHPPGIPGLVLTEAAAAGTSARTGRWVLAHEIGHVLGLVHDDGPAATASLMCHPATAISASVPALSADECRLARGSSCVGRSGGFDGLRPSTIDARATPERATPERGLPILDTPRRTMLDDLD